VNVGVVVIGRNEGKRLEECLDSVVASGRPFVYVDSGSSDGSVALAQSYGARVLQLDPAQSFSAARARNEGFEALTRDDPEIDLVQFLDGDCTLIPGWLARSAKSFDDDSNLAAVVGHLVERRADASIYNRLCALEWESPPGDVRDYGRLGGISMMRARIFRDVGGFRPDVIAGEDSELGVRLGLGGYRIAKLDCPMATHDANMTHFGQWWRRAVRAGHAIGQRSDLHGASSARDCVAERRSTLFWAVGLPLAIVLLAIPTRGASVILLLGYPLLALRIWLHRRASGDSAGESALYAAFTLLGKFANAVGLLRFALNKLARRYEIIEYK
jgi:GT2 family glycosyltransferase